jgi:hypothetical protein
MTKTIEEFRFAIAEFRFLFAMQKANTLRELAH